MAKYKLEIDDALAIDLVLRRMKETSDSRLDASWTRDNILNSLGGHSNFDWVTYESIARDVYFDVWANDTDKALACYLWYKPNDDLRQIRAYCRIVRRTALRKRPVLCTFASLAIVAILLLAGLRVAKNENLRLQLAAYSKLALAFFACSAIPSTAFYAALSTMSGMYLALALCAALWSMRSVGFVERMIRYRKAASTRRNAAAGLAPVNV
jgi:hypothetical protein